MIENSSLNSSIFQIYFDNNNIIIILTLSILALTKNTSPAMIHIKLKCIVKFTRKLYDVIIIV